MSLHIPHPSHPDYAQEVANSIRSLASGQRSRNPAMSGVSTGRLVVEGVVESLKVYRLWKEEVVHGEKMKGNRRDRGEDGRRGKGAWKKETEESEERRKRGRDSGSGSGREGDRNAEKREQLRRRRYRRADVTDELHHQRRHAHRRPQAEKGITDGKAISACEAPSHHELPTSHPGSPEPHTKDRVSGVLHVLKGPDGTPFGFLPSKGKGVGMLAHARTMYRHIKAEQEAGHREKGFVEKRIDGFLQKKKDMRAGGGNRRVELRVKEGGHATGREKNADQKNIEPGWSGVGNFSQSSRHAGRPPTIRVDSFAPVASKPPVRSASSARNAEFRGGEDSRGVRGSPSIRIQSPTPPEPAKSARSSTPYATRSPPQVHTPETEDGRPTTPSRRPSPTLISGSKLASVMPYPATPSVVNMPVPAVPAAHSTAPPSPSRPLLPAPVVPPSTTANSGHGALMAGIRGRGKLGTVADEEKNDKSEGSKGEVTSGFSPNENPVYDATPHSHDVEAHEHAQTIELRGSEQAEELRAADQPRPATPFIAPQPRARLPNDFQSELAAKLGKMNLDRGQDDQAFCSNAPSVLNHRASHESWKTDLSGHEGYNDQEL